MSDIRAVFFDMDGVLIDAADWHYTALNKALGLFGVTISMDEHLSIYNGLSTAQKLARLSDEGRIPRTLHQLIFDKKQEYTEVIFRSRCQPDATKNTLFESLKKTGLLVAVCSNSIRATIDVVLTALSLECDFVLSNQDVKQPKPNPDIYLLAMRRCGLAPDQCLIVEDSAHGIEAARRSGAAVMEVPGPEAVTIETVSAYLHQLGRRVAA